MHTLSCICCTCRRISFMYGPNILNHMPGSFNIEASHFGKLPTPPLRESGLHDGSQEESQVDSNNHERCLG
jgi:hypothetical protein